MPAAPQSEAVQLGQCWACFRPNSEQAVGNPAGGCWFLPLLKRRAGTLSRGPMGKVCRKWSTKVRPWSEDEQEVQRQGWAFQKVCTDA